MRLFSKEWQGSTAHIFLLLEFMKPINPASDLDDREWSLILGEPLDRAVERFRAQNYLDKASMHTHLAPKTKAQLKDILATLELSQTGNKPELITRLLTKPEQLALHVERKLLVVTSFGEKLVTAYLSDQERVVAELNALPRAVDLENRDASDKRPTLTQERGLEILKWLSKDVVVAGVVGSLAYDLLKNNWPKLIDVLATGWQTLTRTRVTNLIGIEWCDVPAGRFWMGAASHDKEARDNEKPGHYLYLPAFKIAKYPVTNVLYQVYVNETGMGELPYDWKNGRHPRREENYPVRGVSQIEALSFCRWLSQKVGMEISLPTEAQWEKAARGTDRRIYPWGNQWSASRCNSSKSKIERTTPVDQYSNGVSPYGCYDMVGNVWEWTRSQYKSYPYDPADGRENLNAGSESVLRGGSFLYFRDSSRVACRYWNNPGPRFDVIGFRVVCLSSPISK